LHNKSKAAIYPGKILTGPKEEKEEEEEVEYLLPFGTNLALRGSIFKTVPH
jgi:hypothetical protein